MGYVTLQNVNQFIPPNQIVKSAGTWTPTVAGNLVVESRTAEAVGFYLLIPITLVGSSHLRQGSKLKSVDIWYKIGTAAMAGMSSVTVKKLTLPAAGDAVGSADYTAISLDADHDTEAERITVATHKMTITFTDKPFIADDEGLIIAISCEGALTSAFTIYGAQANFELRL